MFKIYKIKIKKKKIFIWLLETLQMHKIINNQLIRIAVIYDDIVFELVEMDLNAIAAKTVLLNQLHIY